MEQLEDRRLLATLTVNLSSDFIDTDDGDLTLREAVAYVNQDETPELPDEVHIDDKGGTEPLGTNDVIVFDSSVTNPIVLSEGELNITRSVRIYGGGDVTVDAGGSSRVFNVVFDQMGSVADDVVFDHITITGGNASSEGGGINFVGSNDGTQDIDTISIIDTTVTGNTAILSGGGVNINIQNDSSEHLGTGVTILDSQITGNSSISFIDTDEGGAGAFISASGGVDVVISGTDFVDNDAFSPNNPAAGHGGGLHARLWGGFGGDLGANLTIQDSSFSGNTTETKGGGAYILLSGTVHLNGNDPKYVSTATITGSTFTGNTSTGTSNNHHHGGGGLFASIGSNEDDAGAELTITGSTISDNTAAYRGGGVFALFWGDDENSDAAKFTINDSTVSGNETLTGVGGGLYVCEKHGATFTANQITVSGNKALDSTNGRGGGISLGRSGGSNADFVATVKHSTITKNYSPNGGGVYSALTPQAVDAVFDHTIISGNLTATSGGSANNIAGVIDEAMSTYNLWGPSSATLPTGNGNINNSNNNPELHDLVFNGGFARTATHLPMAGSPVIDVGDQNITGEPDHDQRGIGFARKVGTKIDIGAVEYRVGAPRVVDLVISGSASLHKPFSFAQATFDDPSTQSIVETDPYIGSGNQLRNVPVGLADTYTVHFDEKMDPDSFENDSLDMIGLRFADQPTLAFDVTVAPDGYSATWQFTNVSLRGDHYLIRLDDSVTDLAGNQLDGEWTNPGDFDTVNSAVSEFPSGDETEGGDFNFVALILPGDLDLDGDVDGLDAGDMIMYWAASIPLIVSSFGLGDLDGDGFVNAQDAGTLFTNWNGAETGIYQSFSVLVIVVDWDGDGVVEAGDGEDDRVLFAAAFLNEDDEADLNRDEDWTEADLNIFDAFEGFGIVIDIVT